MMCQIAQILFLILVKTVEVTNEVNSWAEKETNGLIKEVLPSGLVDSSMMLILANALYYRGEWNEKFDASNTKDHDFHLLNGSSVQVPFMTSKKEQLMQKMDFQLYERKFLGFEASKVLKGLGLVLPFSPFSGEGLTEMVDSPVGRDLYVSGIINKSFIEVNEEGTEAATGSVSVVLKASPPRPTNKIDFVADYPFLFIIREDMTNVVLFIGHLLNPLAS
ncbi:hypothetical protein U1Q18_013327 [Sarracenia purpurea var. burkii]